MRCSNSCVSLKKKYIIYKTVSGTNLRGNRGWDAMTLREIMKTNVGPERLEPSLPQETEIHHLRPEAVDEGVVYEVVNELGDKVGELAGSQLAFLVRRAVELDLNELLNAIEDGVVVLDREGRICYENEAYSRIIGVPMRKTIGRDMHVIEPDALLLRVLESGKPDARKWHCIKSVGKYVSMRMFPVWRNGVVAGAFSIFRDVTELNRLGMEVERITQVAEELTSQLDVELSRFQMIGQDPQFRTLLSRAVTAAKTDATVLIRGENGVGKEGFAKLIHQASPRRNRPFITVNCAAIPEALIESELFGFVFEGTAALLSSSRMSSLCPVAGTESNRESWLGSRAASFSLLRPKSWRFSHAICESSSCIFRCSASVCSSSFPLDSTRERLVSRRPAICSC